VRGSREQTSHPPDQITDRFRNAAATAHRTIGRYHPSHTSLPPLEPAPDFSGVFVQRPAVTGAILPVPICSFGLRKFTYLIKDRNRAHAFTRGLHSTITVL
jgi:hypothetical protein